MMSRIIPKPPETNRAKRQKDYKENEIQVTPVGVYNINQNNPHMMGKCRDWPFWARRPCPGLGGEILTKMGYFQVLIHRRGPDAVTLGSWQWVTIHENWLVKIEAPDRLFLPEAP